MTDLHGSGVMLRDVHWQCVVEATDEYPRNMGADLVELRDGRLLLAFSQWLGGTHDHDCSRVMGMVSVDTRRSWIILIWLPWLLWRICVMLFHSKPISNTSSGPILVSYAWNMSRLFRGRVCTTFARRAPLP